jgi:N-acetylneuraminate synthase
MVTVEIGSRSVGDGQPIYVIAEAGSNHNGSLDQALRLIDVAATAGADAVKFQTFKAARMYPRSAGQSDYLKVSKPIYRIIEEMEMPETWLPDLAGYCRDKSLEFISTPFDERSADLLAPFVRVFKIASYEITHTPLLRHVAAFDKPMIVSTGATSLDEVRRAVEACAEAGNERIVLMQCTAKYPAPMSALNLASLRTIREATGRLVGFSDHSRDPIVAPVAAVALGACAIEKHFTLSNLLAGPDHKFAVEPNELRELVAAVREAFAALGHGRKEVLPDEAELYAFARRSIFTTRPVRAGEALDPDNIAVLRCGTLGFGLDPARYPELLGRVAARDLPAETLVRLEDVR